MSLTVGAADPGNWMDDLILQNVQNFIAIYPKMRQLHGPFSISELFKMTPTVLLLPRAQNTA